MVATASSVATIAAVTIVDRVLREPSLAVIVPATLAGMFVAAGLVYAVARVVLEPAMLVSQPLPPLSRFARLELGAGIAALLAITGVLRVWLGVDARLSLPLL